MTKDGLWELPASMGAINALRENAGITSEQLAKAEEFALERTKGDRFEACILRADVERAVRGE